MQIKDPSGKSAPVGGFQNGGWYSGYQYYNGSFAPQAGMIHPNSPQQGAGQAVSSEVNKQSSVAQGLKPEAIDSFVQQQNQQAVNENPAIYRSSMSSGGGTGSGLGLGSLGTGSSGLDLQKIYSTAKNNPELLATQAEYDKIQKELIDAETQINDNPFLGEATRVGRIQKLREQAQKELSRVEGKLSRLNADAETSMNIALKQYDINSQEYQKNLSYLNTLISTGAIAGASSQDLATLASATGISTNMLQTVVDKANKGEPPQIVTSVGEDGALNVIAIDPNTGKVLSTDSVAGVGKVDNGSGSMNKTEYATVAMQDAKDGVTLRNMLKIYEGILEPNDVYRIYNLNSRYGTAKETTKQLKEMGITK